MCGAPNPHSRTRIDKVGDFRLLIIQKMASSQAFSSPFLSAGASITNPSTPQNDILVLCNKQRRASFKIQAVKLPAGVELPKQEPKFQAPFLGFTKTAETWNSRACMIGLIGTFIVELILNKGILEIIGVEVGKGLDIPL
ncbi:hypothetical protein BUALT_Bualt09G0115100 [Buddleja alternifolia]|uniref:Uncharacterized protein n=1 Tax=Buddleja alternifolia TaxID=168488 RepID=A0AAV6XCL4_9LAMI|nr:hypothetical protein BUALT_Bualt09G0115100 [Buddleja alternifolia]